MRLLLGGEWEYEFYEEALASGFRRCGVDVVPFRIDRRDVSLSAKLQRRFLIGPVLTALNRSFEDMVRAVRPDAIFLRSPVCILPQTLANIRREHPKIVLVSYCNDNPFDDGGRLWKWRHYIGNLGLCHLNYFYRPSNVDWARLNKIPSPKLLLPYFVEGLHQPMAQVDCEFRNSIVFTGHYEPDGRHLLLEHLQRNGFPVRLFGTRWEELNRSPATRDQEIRPVRGIDYVQSIAGAEIALVFLSKRNRDTYTRRCFEITACKTLMIAPRTEDLCKLFTEDREALYFSSPQELLGKVKGVLADSKRRMQIAEAGYRRCIRDQHNNVKRAADVCRDIECHVANNLTRRFGGSDLVASRLSDTI